MCMVKVSADRQFSVSAQRINSNNGVVTLIAEETSLFLVLDAYC